MKKGKFVPKSDFKMEFIMMVEALENTGYIVNVTRDVDNQTRWDTLKHMLVCRTYMCSSKNYIGYRIYTIDSIVLWCTLCDA